MKYFKLALLLSVALLSACNEQPDTIYVKDNFEVDGCSVKYVNHPRLPNFYIARCGETTTESHQYSSGKARYTTANIVVESTVELRKRLEKEESRDKALLKLTEDEKTLLGVK